MQTPPDPRKSAGPKLRINRMIRAREVRVIGSEGEHLGVVPLEEAFVIAAAQGLDLVEVSPDAEPPVCKIIDYGKFRYMQDKRGREAKKKQRVIQVKEVRPAELPVNLEPPAVGGSGLTSPYAAAP